MVAFLGLDDHNIGSKGLEPLPVAQCPGHPGSITWSCGQITLVTWEPLIVESFFSKFNSNREQQFNILS